MTVPCATKLLYSLSGHPIMHLDWTSSIRHCFSATEYLFPANSYTLKCQKFHISAPPRSTQQEQKTIRFSLAV